jgi:hypothetical protein
MATLWLTSSALAGGFAITTLDTVPQDIRAGQTYPIGYTIRQHGVTPVRDATPKVIISSVSGERLSFAGSAEGEPGHYVSQVTFPSEGEWAWEVDQSPFPAPQKLGSIAVAAVPAPIVVAPAELALLGLVALAAVGVGVALRQVKRVARPA